MRVAVRIVKLIRRPVDRSVAVMRCTGACPAKYQMRARPSASVVGAKAVMCEDGSLARQVMRAPGTGLPPAVRLTTKDELSDWSCSARGAPSTRVPGTTGVLETYAHARVLPRASGATGRWDGAAAALPVRATTQAVENTRMHLNAALVTSLRLIIGRWPGEWRCTPRS